MNDHLRIEVNVSFKRNGRGSRLEASVPDESEGSLPTGRLPKVTKLMALAIRFEHLLSIGAADDYAELARLSHVTRARLSQIMNLRLLAPDMQEAILFMPTITSGRDRILLRHLQTIALTPDWRIQRRLWKELNGVGPKVSESSE